MQNYLLLEEAKVLVKMVTQETLQLQLKHRSKLLKKRNMSLSLVEKSLQTLALRM